MDGEQEGGQPEAEAGGQADTAHMEALLPRGNSQQEIRFVNV
jgi:hypothetical protein